MMRAARFGRADSQQLLLAARGCVDRRDCRGWSALEHAAARGHVQNTAVLCQERELCEASLVSALVATAQYGHLDCIRVLLRARAAPNQLCLSNGGTALVTAAEWGHSEVLACLLAAKADPSFLDGKENSAAGMAAKRSYERCLALLSTEWRQPATRIINACVIRARHLSADLACCVDIDTGQQLLVSPTFCQGLDERAVNTSQFVERCTLKKEQRTQWGVYLQAEACQIEQDRKSPLHILKVLSLETRSHDGWEARKTRHGADHSRFKVFAEFVMHTLDLRPGCVVLDAAGGKGGTSLELLRLGAAKVYLVDPAEHVGAAVSPELVEQHKVQVLQMRLDESFLESHHWVLEEIDAIVGLHPDEATDLVCSIGLKYGKALACVPCCVFPSLFPNRRRKEGQGVVTCNGLVSYLVEQSPRMQVQRLTFEGANQVVFCLADACTEKEFLS